MISDRIGVDGLAVCADQNDLSLFDEYNFEGLMNEVLRGIGLGLIRDVDFQLDLTLKDSWTVKGL